MSGRIGTLHLRYRTPAGGSIGAALVPQIDRALRLGLGDALEERLSAVADTGEAVVVIRELNARVAIGRSDWTLDSRIVDKISRASVDAVVEALAAPASDDSVVRFADQAEFIGSFIVDLMRESAWERWYYGAFHRYRQGDARTAISAVLADHSAQAAAVLGWLARRGQLATVLELLGPEVARRLVTARADDSDGSSRANEVAPLVAAAFQLLEAAGWPSIDAAARAALVSEYQASAPLPPTWTDRRSLSAWLLRFVRFAASALAGRGATRVPRDAGAVQALFAGSLDWLDVGWLAPQIEHLRHGSPASLAAAALSTRRVLTSRHEHALARIAELVRQGRLRIEGASRDALVVRLVAAIAEEGPADQPPDRALVAVIEVIADARRASIASGVDSTRVISAAERSSSPTTGLPGGLATLVGHVDAVRAAGPAAVALFQQLVKASSVVEEAGDLTSGAGLYLLTRTILDVRLSALSRDAGMPFEPLLAALADEWLQLAPPFDRPTAAWIGAERPDIAALDGPGARLADLEDALFGLLCDQRTIDALPDDESLGVDPAQTSIAAECSKATRIRIARIAWMILRAWSRWLPGISGATPSFLVRNCLRRSGHVRMSNEEIAVELDPAPLDVVLEMAGYFRALEHVPWLNRKRITFKVNRRPGA